jgi:hypothetical protein
VLAAPSAAQTALTWGPVPGWGHCRPASCKTSLPWLVVMVRMIRFTHWEVVHVVVLTHTLEKLRAREGVTLARLEGDAHGVAELLLNLAAVRRHATIHNVELSQAALAVVSDPIPRVSR